MKFLPIAALALAAAGSALAQDENLSLASFDTDKDGSVNRVEAQADPALMQQFKVLDENANGALEPAEFARFEITERTRGPGLGTPGDPGEPGSPPATPTSPTTGAPPAGGSTPPTR